MKPGASRFAQSSSPKYESGFEIHGSAVGPDFKQVIVVSFLVALFAVNCFCSLYPFLSSGSNCKLHTLNGQPGVRMNRNLNYLGRIVKRTVAELDCGGRHPFVTYGESCEIESGVRLIIDVHRVLSGRSGIEGPELPVPLDNSHRGLALSRKQDVEIMARAPQPDFERARLSGKRECDHRDTIL